MTDLVVFYSLTGKSRATAQRLADALPAELVEIVEERPKTPGIIGFIQGILDSLRKRRPAIKDTPEVTRADRVSCAGRSGLSALPGLYAPGFISAARLWGNLCGCPIRARPVTGPRQLLKSRSSWAAHRSEWSPSLRMTSPQARRRARPGHSLQRSSPLLGMRLC
jgi:hypothetical protein